ncbi:hypothetical protein [Reichenbachiella versicolor]|uniref:hypothetical protein n=1 Tax=Reichenbachiella versicolor TaxID=1821036 RepID=UPI001C8768E2|nr:hypothetical protein [Reichenbachiella versicolor]
MNKYIVTEKTVQSGQMASNQSLKGIEKNKLYTIARTNNTESTLYKDGVSVYTNAQNSISMENKNLYILAENGESDSPLLFADDKLSIVALGAAVGFNHAAFNTAIQTYFGL